MNQDPVDKKRLSKTLVLLVVKHPAVLPQPLRLVITLQSENEARLEEDKPNVGIDRPESRMELGVVELRLVVVAWA